MDKRSKSSPTNFILFITDQHRADHLGCYGNRVVRSPNIDRLAAGGTRFERCFVASPICMPNRASLMTGRMPSLHGVRCNGIPLDRRSNTFVELLGAAGYATALIGKAHLQPMTGLPPQLPRNSCDGFKVPVAPRFAEARLRRAEDRAYEDESLTRWAEDEAHGVETPFYGFNHVELCTMHGDLVHGDYYRWISRRVRDPEILRGPKNALPDPRITVPQAYRTRVPEELYPTRYIEERSIAYLKQAGESPDRPFFLTCSFPDPHHPFTPPGRYWDMYDPAAVDLPPSFGAASSVALVEALRRERAEGSAIVNSTTPFAVSEREAREAIALTYGMITMIDDAIGAILGQLAESGLAENTVVIFTSDHGDFMGDYGVLLKAAWHRRGLTRVPLIWLDPAKPEARVSAGLCATPDISATILDRAELRTFNGMQGKSLLPLVGGESQAVRHEVLIEEDGHAPAFGMTQPIRARSILTERYRLSIYDPEGWIELFDLADDPLELTNLADRPEFQPLRSRLFERMAWTMMRLCDESPYPIRRA